MLLVVRLQDGWIEVCSGALNRCAEQSWRYAPDHELAHFRLNDRGALVPMRHGVVAFYHVRNCDPDYVVGIPLDQHPR
jgi:hypothetical protein